MVTTDCGVGGRLMDCTCDPLVTSRSSPVNKNKANKTNHVTASRCPDLRRPKSALKISLDKTALTKRLRDDNGVAPTNGDTTATVTFLFPRRPSVTPLPRSHGTARLLAHKLPVAGLCPVCRPDLSIHVSDNTHKPVLFQLGFRCSYTVHSY
jgi:hypothetical protein